MNEIKNLIKVVAEEIRKGCSSSCDKEFAQIYKAYETYQDEELNNADGIFDVRSAKDFKILVDLLGVEEAVTLYNFCYKQKKWYVGYGESYDAPKVIEDIYDWVAGSATEIATCVVTYPYVGGYRELYTRYVTDAVLEECDRNTINITCFAD